MGKGHTFDGQIVKRSLISYRLEGYSYPELSRIYKADHTTVLYHCKMAGLVFGEKKKVLLNEMICRGVPLQEICVELNVTPRAVEFFCIHFGVNGKNNFSRKKKHFVTIQPVGKMETQLPKENTNTLIREDSRGVRWRRGEDEWICLGRDKFSEFIDSPISKKKILESRRIKMLKY